jgi:hypothetical protein
VRVAVRVLFEAPTPAGLAGAAGRGAVVVPPNLIPAGAAQITPAMVTLAELTAGQIGRAVARVAGGAANVADIYPLAPLQEGMFFHHLLAGDGPDVYLESSLLRCASRARLEEFIAVLEQVIARHDVLRTSVAWEGLPEPVQVVWRHAPLPVTEVTLHADADADADAGGAGGGALSGGGDGGDGGPRDALLAVAGLRMDLGTAPLLRLHIAADPAGPGWLVLLQRHHLVLDHIGLEVVQAEIAALLAGHGDQLPEPLAFRDFVAQARLGVPAEEHRQYFAALLGDVTEPTAPFGLLDVHGDGTAIERAGCPVDAALAGQVRELARTLSTTPATIFHLAWARVLAAVSGRDDVVFGTVLLGRMDAGPGADRVPGPLMNTLPVRVRIGAGDVAGAVTAMRSQLAGLLAPRARPAGPGPASQRRPRPQSPVHRPAQLPAQSQPRKPPAHLRHHRGALRGRDQLSAGRQRRRHRGRVLPLGRDDRAGQPGAGVRAAGHVRGEPGRRAAGRPRHPAAPGAGAG